MKWLETNGVPLKMVHLDQGIPRDYNAEYTHAQYKLQRLREVEEALGLECILHFDDYAEVAYEFGKAGIPVVCVRTPQEIEELVAEPKHLA